MACRRREKPTDHALWPCGHLNDLDGRDRQDADDLFFCVSRSVHSFNRAGFAGDSNSRAGPSISSKTANKYSQELRERSARLVLDNDGQHGLHWQATMSIAAKTGCARQTLNDWVRTGEVNGGKRRTRFRCNHRILNFSKPLCSTFLS